MIRLFEFILGVLMLLIIMSPFMALAGVPLAKVVLMDLFWAAAWFLIAGIGRKYGH